MEEDKIYVCNKDDVLIAVFDKEDENPIINPRISETQNAESVLTFSVSPTNPKWEQIKNPENIYVVKGKAFSTNFEGCFREVISDNNEDLISITAYERQKLLSRKYVRAWNSETGFDAIDTFMVVVLSNGNLDLKNNGELVNSVHLPGTSGYALDALLYGTGWTTGICDVEGSFDLETDQIDIYENILKVQQIWGGILVFDSVNKVVHHRNETLFLPYNGYEVKYEKNMQSLERLYNNKIITKLCPLGEGGLNIKSINDGSEWLTNYSYTNSTLEGIENNPDIYDPVQLKKWGERKLKDLCKPRKELTVEAVLLYQLEGYELETIGLNDIVDVINYAGIENDLEQLRVVGYNYGIWDYSDAVLELSDITLDSTDIFKKSVQATNSINEGTLDASKVVDFFKNGESITERLRIIDRTVTENSTEVSKTDDKIAASAEQVTKKIDDLNDKIVEQYVTKDVLEITANGLKNQLIKKGGANLLKNSVGFFKNEYWERNPSEMDIVSFTDTDVQNNNVSDNAILLQNGQIMQQQVNLKNGIYNISFNYKKKIVNSQISVEINDNVDLLEEENVWTQFEKEVEVTNNSFYIKFTSNAADSCLISDLMLIQGQYSEPWSQNSNEVQTDTVEIGKGIQVTSNTKQTYTRMDADGNRTFKYNYDEDGKKIINPKTDEIMMETTDKGVRTPYIGPTVDNLGNKKQNEAEIGGIIIQQVENQTWISSLL